MRPAPKPHVAKAIAVIIAASVVYALLGWNDDRLSDTQVYLSAAAQKYGDQSLYSHDLIFGPSGVWRFCPPLTASVLSALSGKSDQPSNAFRLLMPLVAAMYLAGMYILLYRQCHSWSISAFTAVLSSTVIYTLGKGYWGVGPLPVVTPWTIALAFVPWIVLAFLKFKERPLALLLVFAAAGAIGNFHIVVATNLTLALLAAYVGSRDFRPRAWAVACVCAAVAAVCMMPSASYLTSLRHELSQGHVAAGYQATRRALLAGDLPVLYPEMLKSAFNWILVIAGILVIPAVMVLSRIERFRVKDMKVWVYFIAGALAVALGLQGLSQLIGRQMETSPPAIDFVQAGSLLMLPMYVLLAHAITDLFRLMRPYRLLLRLALAVVMAAWMLPSDNLRDIRYAAMNTATMYMAEAEKPRDVRRYHQHRGKQNELMAIAAFARNSTGADAVFVTDLAEFRARARRSIVTCSDDARYLYYLSPWRLEAWTRHVDRQGKLLHPSNARADGNEIRQYIHALMQSDLQEWRQHVLAGPSAPAQGDDEVIRAYVTTTSSWLAGVKEWYVILDAYEAPENPQAMSPITPQGWGNYYQLYKVETN